jgi:hypothetical protein
MQGTTTSGGPDRSSDISIGSSLFTPFGSDCMNTLRSKRRASVAGIAGAAAPTALIRRYSAETRLRLAAASKRLYRGPGGFLAFGEGQDIGRNLRHPITGKIRRIGESNSSNMRVKGFRDSDGKISRWIAPDPALQIDDNILDHRNAPVAGLRPSTENTVEDRVAPGIDAGQHKRPLLIRWESIQPHPTSSWRQQKCPALRGKVRSLLLAGSSWPEPLHRFQPDLIVEIVQHDHRRALLSAGAGAQVLEAGLVFTRILRDCACASSIHLRLTAHSHA